MKTNHRLVCILFFILGVVPLLKAQQTVIEKDLQPEWLVYKNNEYLPVKQNADATSVIYFQLDAFNSPGEYLTIKSNDQFTLFINNKLATRARTVMLNLDSLSQRYSSNSLLFGIYQPNLQDKKLMTHLVSKRQPGLMVYEERQGSFIRDFVILGAVLLSLLVVVVVRLNPKLASDYFSVPRIFSLREIDDSQLAIRIGSSTNILFYAYCSLLIGYFLFVVFYFVSSFYPVTSSFEAFSFGGSVVQWVKLSFIVLVLLFMKVVLVYGMAFLFGIGGVAGVHFFNWVRMLLVFFGVLTVALFVYVIWHGYEQATHVLMLKLVAWILGGWMILVFLKLGSKSDASMFHLFSYICATELIPFLIIIKVLYN